MIVISTKIIMYLYINQMVSNRSGNELFISKPLMYVKNPLTITKESRISSDKTCRKIYFLRVFIWSSSYSVACYNQIIPVSINYKLICVFSLFTLLQVTVPEDGLEPLLDNTYISDRIPFNSDRIDIKIGLICNAFKLSSDTIH